MRRLRTRRDLVNERLERGWRRLHVKKQNGRCYYCGDPFSRPNNGSSSLATPTLDHKQPLDKDGEHSILNTCAACLECNRRKGTMTEKQFKALLAAEQMETPCP